MCVYSIVQSAYLVGIVIVIYTARDWKTKRSLNSLFYVSGMKARGEAGVRAQKRKRIYYLFISLYGGREGNSIILSLGQTAALCWRTLHFPFWNAHLSVYWPQCSAFRQRYTWNWKKILACLKGDIKKRKVVLEHQRTVNTHERAPQVSTGLFWRPSTWFYWINFKYFLFLLICQIVWEKTIVTKNTKN